MLHVFISYVSENLEQVQTLRDELTKRGIKAWLDRNDIAPGVRWKQAIRRAIRDGAFFIACFSNEYNNRSITYMNEELTLAIEMLRQRPTDQAWFIPVKLSECEVPDRDIGAGETLQDINYVDLYKDWDNGILRIHNAIEPKLDTQNLIRLLESENTEDARIMSELIKALSIDEPLVRDYAVIALGKTKDTTRIVPELIRLLDDNNASVRSSTAEVLGSIGDVIAVPALLKTLSDKDQKVRYRAASALGRIKDTKTVPVLIRALSAEDTDICKIAALTLGYIGDIRAVTKLIEILNDENASIRAQAASALGRIKNDRATPMLIEALDDKDEHVRYSAAWALQVYDISETLKAEVLKIVKEYEKRG